MISREKIANGRSLLRLGRCSESRRCAPWRRHSHTLLLGALGRSGAARQEAPKVELSLAQHEDRAANSCKACEANKDPKGY